MLGITHAVVGGAVGSFVISPFLAFFLGIISHLVVDKIPHFWPSKKNHQYYLISIDAVCSLLIITYLYISTGNFFSSILWGALGGVSVDIVFVIFAGLYEPFLNSAIRVWHEVRQIHKTQPIYILPDIFLTVISLVYLLKIGS